VDYCVPVFLSYRSVHPFELGKDELPSKLSTHL
jgi:hypothetical protein